jgi:hypothetical protein
MPLVLNSAAFWTNPGRCCFCRAASGHVSN